MTLLHGCNPWGLSSILRDDLLQSIGKANLCAVWTSPQYGTALAYPMELPDIVVPLSPSGPWVRFVWLPQGEKRLRLRFAGRKPKSGAARVNEQVAYPFGVLRRRSLLIAIMSPVQNSESCLADMHVQKKRKLLDMMRAARPVVSFSISSSPQCFLVY